MKTSCFKVTLACLLAWVVRAAAQSPGTPDSTNAAPNPQTSFVPAAWSSPSATAPNQTNSFLQPAGIPTAGPALFQWGAVGLSPRPSYELMYSTGILASPGHPVATTLQSFSPGVVLQLGSNWTLGYTPTWEVYSNRLFHDTLDHAAEIDGKIIYRDWTLQFSQNYLRTSDPLVDTASQTPEQIYATAFTADYGYGDRTLLELGLDQNIRISSVAPDYYEWSTQDWLHFQASPQVDTAIGPGGGYVVVDPGFDMAYVRPEARLTWQVTDKVGLDLRGGVESREFLGSGGGSLTTPVYAATLNYRPVDGTTFTAAADRDVEIAYVANEISEVDKYSAGLQQRLLGHFYFGAEIARQNSHYVAVGAHPVGVRDDGADTYQLSLATTLLRHLTLSLQFSRILNDSNVAGFGFASDQYGLVLGYKY